MSAQISKRRKFIADGVFRAELNDFFTRELSEEGYSGCDVRVTHARTEVSAVCSKVPGRPQIYYDLLDHHSCYPHPRGLG
jgi:ribosomal protein S3